MRPTSQQLKRWLTAKEDEHLEFKGAKANFHFEKLVKYCAALANEGGGSIILGVTDKRPRRVFGSTAFAELERTKAGLIDKLRLHIEAEEIAHPDGRVLVFTAPSRPIGLPVAVEGAYWMRAGEELAPMTPDMLRRIFDESGPDFSAEICPHATLADLDRAAIDIFRARWLLKSQNERLRDMPVEQLLKDAELVTDRGVTYAALILLGTRPALGRFLSQAEVVFEYRSSDATGPANQRDEYREGFLPYHDILWDTVNLRNDLQHYLEGFVMHHIPTFRETAVREAVLNAVSDLFPTVSRPRLGPAWRADPKGKPRRPSVPEGGRPDRNPRPWPRHALRVEPSVLPRTGQAAPDRSRHCQSRTFAVHRGSS
jgi:ATP-dependent DNA helicase RecG